MQSDENLYRKNGIKPQTINNIPNLITENFMSFFKNLNIIFIPSFGNTFYNHI
jgi:hypothetical protein